MISYILPKETAIGDIISVANYRFLKKNDKRSRYTFAGSIYFERMKAMKLYTTDAEKIKNRIQNLKLSKIFEINLI